MTKCPRCGKTLGTLHREQNHRHGERWKPDPTTQGDMAAAAKARRAARKVIRRDLADVNLIPSKRKPKRPRYFQRRASRRTA